MSTLSLGLRDAEPTAIGNSHRVSVAGLSVTIHSGVIASMVLIPLLSPPPLPEVTVASPPIPRFVSVTLPPAPGGGHRDAPETPRKVSPAMVPTVIPSLPTETPGGIADEGLDISEDASTGEAGPGVGPGVAGGDCVLGALCGPPLPVATPAPVVVRVSALQAPKLLDQQAPRYPEMARSIGLSADVIIEAHVGADGRVLSASVLRSHPLFDDAAMESVKSRRYKPLLLNGVATEFLTTITVRFTARR